MRRMATKNEIAEDKKEQLDSIGFQWDPPSNLGSVAKRLKPVQGGENAEKTDQVDVSKENHNTPETPMKSPKKKRQKKEATSSQPVKNEWSRW